MYKHTGSKEQKILCILKECAHSKARNWVQCTRYLDWWHCVCADVIHKKAVSDSFEFVCSACVQ